MEDHGLLKCLVLLLKASVPGSKLSDEELIDMVRRFLSPMRSAILRRAKRNVSVNLLAHLGKLWETGVTDEGNIPDALTTRYLGRTLLQCFKKASTNVKLCMTNNTLRPSVGKSNQEPGQPICDTEKTVDDIFPCPQDAYFTEVLVPMVQSVTNQLTLALMQDVQRTKEVLRDNDASDSDSGGDPEGYEAIHVASEFLVNSGKGLSGGGNRGSDAVIPRRFWVLNLEFFEKYRGAIPLPEEIATADDARRYLMPWCYPGFGDASSDESGASGAEGGQGRGQRSADLAENSEESDYEYEEDEEESEEEEAEESAIAGADSDASADA